MAKARRGTGRTGMLCLMRAGKRAESQSAMQDTPRKGPAIG